MDEIFGMAEDHEMLITDSEEDKRINASLDSIIENQWAKKHDVDARSEPVVEILSVRLYNNNNKSEIKGYWEIYGNIYVYDVVKNDSKCFIYELNEEDDYPERVPYHGDFLSLTGPDEVMSMDNPIIFIDIRDTISGETIISHFAPLEKTVDHTGVKRDHQFEQFKKLLVCGNSCCAEVEYLALTFGVFGPIQIDLVKPESGSNTLLEQQEEEFEVYGTISANYNLLCSEKKDNCIVLFEIKEDSNYFEWVRLGRPVILSRSVVAVPAYSSITIQVDLWDRATKKPIIQGSTSFDTANLALHKFIAGLNCLNAKVTIAWKEPFKLDIINKRDDVPWGLYSHFLPVQAVEVFSLFIGRQSEKQLRLHGMITFGGISGDLVLFNRDKDDPYTLPPGSYILPLEGPNKILTPWYRGFHISVNLEDVDGCVSIKGFAQSSNGHEFNKVSWNNRLLCSVVKGEHDESFAAIHYTLFDNAAKATLKVHFFFKKDDEHYNFEGLSKIYGSLVALYDKYESKTSYDRLYYRNILFERLEENPLQVPCTNFDMQLSKFVFAAPQNIPVHIAVDLSCVSSHFNGSLKVTKELHICKGVCDDVIVEGDKFGIIISVGWSQAA